MSNEPHLSGYSSRCVACIYPMKLLTLEITQMNVTWMHCTSMASVGYSRRSSCIQGYDHGLLPISRHRSSSSQPRQTIGVRCNLRTTGRNKDQLVHWPLLLELTMRGYHRKDYRSLFSVYELGSLSSAQLGLRYVHANREHK